MAATRHRLRFHDERQLDTRRHTREIYRHERSLMSVEHVDVLIVGAGPVRHRRRLPPAGQLPGKTYAILEARDASAGPGTCSAIPGIRSDSDMYTLGYSFRPWTRGQVDRRRAVDPRLRPRDGAATAASRRRSAFNHRVVRAEWSTADARWTVEAQRGDTRGDRAPELRLPVHVQRLLPLRRGLHAGLRGHRALRRADRAPAALDRRHRLRRQARRRDRQRRDRRDARPRDGPDGGARHDAAALAQLRRLAAGEDPIAKLAAPRAAGAAWPMRSCAGRTCCSRCSASSSAGAGRS